MLINHYGLNVRDPEAKAFLTDSLRRFFFESEAEDIDTSKQGSISW